MGKVFEEGDVCPEEDCPGVLEYKRVDACFCHISQPCNACVEAPLVCPHCGEIPEEN
jgi:hypothetical protein